MTKNSQVSPPIEIPDEWKTRQTSNIRYEESVKLAVVRSVRLALANGHKLNHIAGAFKIKQETVARWLETHSESKSTPITPKRETKNNEIRIPSQWKNRKIETVPWTSAQGKKIKRNVYPESVKIAVANACHEAVARGVSIHALSVAFCNSVSDWMKTFPDQTRSGQLRPSRRGRTTELQTVEIHVDQAGHKNMDVRYIPAFESGRANIVIKFPDGITISGLPKADLQDFLSLNLN